MSITQAHLYVEKYNRFEQEMLLDFVAEDEFIYFRNPGDSIETMHLSQGQYVPTMLLVHDCSPMRKIHEGAILTVNMAKLLAIKDSTDLASDNLDDRNYNRPAMVYLEISSGKAFASLIDEEDSSASDYIQDKFIFHPASTWDGPPCALNFLSPEFQLQIWNVGQGNTNSISDRNTLTLFDFGASIYYPENQLRNILQNHASLFRKRRSISLIISHWDSDHYNLLCVADHTFLQNICCVFYPPDIITLTAKQAAARLITYCKCRTVIPSAARSVPRKCGMQVVYSGSGYSLFTGETSTDLNRSGLSLAVYSKTAAAMLTADHTNYQVWNQMYSHITDKKLHVVVPHHGGSCGKATIKTSASPGIAAVSVGSNNYRHPHRSTLAAYRRAQYNVIRTDHFQQDIIIPMQ